MQPIQRLNAFGSIGFAVQQRLEIDPGEFREQVRKTDEAAEHAVAVEAVGEIGMARTPDDVTLVPVSARIGIQHRSQPLAIERGVGARGGLAEELPEFGVAGKCPKRRQLELEQRKVRFIEVDRVHLGRSRGEIRQCVAPAG